jgi:hypothetical protein
MLEECRVNKSFLSAFLTVILISGLVLVGAVGFVAAQASDFSSIPAPSVPEFTVTIVDSSYNVSTTYSTDPYTGKTTPIEGYHVERRTIEVKIKNQPFSSFWLQESPQAANWTVNFYYNVRYKGHFEDVWHDLYLASDGYPLQDSGSDYTVLSYEGGYSPTEGISLQTGAISTTLPAGGMVDFQVEAMIGYVHRDESISAWAPWVLKGQRSGWSETQTITIPGSSSPSSPATTPMPTPTQTPVPTPIPVPGQSAFSVESNSTVTDLFFNSTNSELSFTVNGKSGTSGYVKVSVAKNLLSSIQDLKVYLDGKSLDVTINSDASSWFLSFNYLHSIHHVTISLATNAASVSFIGLEFFVGLGVGIAIVLVGVFLLFYLKRRNR